VAIDHSVAEIGPTAIFRFFKMAATAIWDFQNFEILTVNGVNRVKLHHLAKFRGDRSNRC